MIDINELIEQSVTELGYEFVYLERSNRGKMLRVFIDKTGGITVDDCALVSNQIVRVLEVEGFDQYERLEVSSPGLDRELKKEEDFVRFAGRNAKFQVFTPIKGRRNFVGILKNVENDGVVVTVDGEAIFFKFNSIKKARLVPDI